MVPLLALPEGGEWIVILVIVILLFGAKKLPELTRNTARAMKEFEKARRSDDDETPAQVTPPAATTQVTQPQAQPEAPAQLTQPLAQPEPPAQPQNQDRPQDRAQ